MKKELLRRLRNWAIVALAVFIVYGLAYFLLMVRNVPALSPTGEIQFRSSFRFAPPAGRLGELSIEASSVTLANYIFCPADEIYYRIAPPGRALNTLPPVGGRKGARKREGVSPKH